MNTAPANTAPVGGGRIGVWNAVREQAECWSTAPSVTLLVDTLRQPPGEATTEVPGILRELKAGYGGAMTNALRLGFVVEMLVADTSRGPGESAATSQALQEWIRVAQAVERAHRLTIAWVRSRLPDYPVIRAPQLARNTALTTTDFTPMLAWPVQDQRAGLQNLPTPPPIGNLLGATPALNSLLTTTNHAVADALAKTDEWMAFREASRGLTAAGKNDLRAARRTLTERLSPQAVDDHDENLVMPRSNYRAFVLGEVLGTLSGSAQLYATTFGAVNHLIDRAASDVFAALVSQKEVPALPSIELEFGAASAGRIEFTLPGLYGLIMECGDVAWLDDPLVRDAVHLQSISHSFDATGTGTTRIGASLLVGTGDAWDRPSE
jgi:hypothetical protein